eukprot:81982-Prymnesium_polylepis.2
MRATCRTHTRGRDTAEFGARGPKVYVTPSERHGTNCAVSLVAVTCPLQAVCLFVCLFVDVDRRQWLNTHVRRQPSQAVRVYVCTDKPPVMALPLALVGACVSQSRRLSR